MGNLKISDYFITPISGDAIKAIAHDQTVEFNNDGVAPFNAAIKAINSYDSHVERIKQLEEGLKEVLVWVNDHPGMPPVAHLEELLKDK